MNNYFLITSRLNFLKFNFNIFNNKINLNFIFFNKLLKNNYNASNYIFLKFFKFYNKLSAKNLNFIDNIIIHKNLLNNFNFYTFNKYNVLFYKNFIKMFKHFSFENNFLIIDNNFKNVLPLNNYIFGYKNMFIYKNFFFFDFKKFTYKSWISKYEEFLKHFYINLIIITDYLYFQKFLKVFHEMNIVTTALIPINYIDTYIDYRLFYSGSLKNFEKFIFINLISQIYFTLLNYKIYNKKLNFIKIFYKFSCL